MNVVTVERAMTASLRGRCFMVTAEWSPSDPCAIRLVGPGRRLTWVLSREVVAMALKGKQLGGEVADAACVEIVRSAEGDGGDMVEVVRHHRSLQPVSVWFAAADWEQLLEDTLCIVPLGDERKYIDWPVVEARLLRPAQEAS